MSGPGTATEAQDHIQGWRHRMDAIDEHILRLLNSRSACAVEIRRVKRALGLPVYNPEREASLLARLEQTNPGPAAPHTRSRGTPSRRCSGCARRPMRWAWPSSAR